MNGKTILVTGGTGSIGSRLVRECLARGAATVRVFSRDEYKQHRMAIDLSDNRDRLRFMLGDVRDQQRLQRACDGVDIVFHCAALKHVPACEYNPFEAVRTNVIGTQNLIEAAINANVERAILISTDKAVSPENVLGSSKLLAERLFIAAESWKGKARTVFACVRFGNVLGSRGSVLDVFRAQHVLGQPLSVTHPNMVRYVMTIGQAVGLVLDASSRALGGEMFILKMPTTSIRDIVAALGEIWGEQPRTEEIGIRDGEKMVEQILSEKESFMLKDCEKFYVISSKQMGPIGTYHQPRMLRREELVGMIKEAMRDEVCRPVPAQAEVVH